MKNCPNCKKEVKWHEGFSNTLDHSGRYCSFKCFKEVNFGKQKEKNPEGKIKEIKNKCNQCGKVWHYLESDVSQLRARGVANAMGGCGTCCNPFSFYMLNKANEAGDKIKEMQRCPNCKSSDVTKKAVYHDKK